MCYIKKNLEKPKIAVQKIDKSPIYLNEIKFLFVLLVIASCACVKVGISIMF